MFLLELLKSCSGNPGLSGRELKDDIDLFYLNILPDALPFHAGIPPVCTHAQEVLDEIKCPNGASAGKLCLGFTLHHLLDNLSHCGSLVATTNFSKGFALLSGLKIQEGASRKIKDLFKLVEGKSALYTLHSGVEMAVELCIDDQDINRVLDQACSMFFQRQEKYQELLSHLSRLTEEELEKGMAGMKKRCQTDPFVNGVSLNGFTRRFIIRYLPSSDSPEMEQTVREFLQLAQKHMQELWPPFLEESVNKVLQFDPRIQEMLLAMLGAEDH